MLDTYGSCKPTLPVKLEPAEMPTNARGAKHYVWVLLDFLVRYSLIDGNLG